MAYSAGGKPRGLIQRRNGASERPLFQQSARVSHDFASGPQPLVVRGALLNSCDQQSAARGVAARWERSAPRAWIVGSRGSRRSTTAAARSMDHISEVVPEAEKLWRSIESPAPKFSSCEPSSRAFRLTSFQTTPRCRPRVGQLAENPSPFMRRSPRRPRGPRRARSARRCSRR